MKQLSEFNTLQEAQDYTHVGTRMISNAMIFALLGQYNSLISLRDSTNSNAIAFWTALTSSVTEYNLMLDTDIGKAQRDVLNELVADGSVTEGFRDAAIAYANNKITKPYENTTLVQFNIAKGIYTEREVVGIVTGNNVKVTLVDTLPEQCTLTTWTKEGDFDYSNFGKHCSVYTGQNTYKIVLDNKRIEGKLYVRIPLEEFNFNVEVL